MELILNLVCNKCSHMFLHPELTLIMLALVLEAFALLSLTMAARMPVKDTGFGVLS